MLRSLGSAALAALFLLVGLPRPATAQDAAPDTLRSYTLDQIVVTADRSARRLASSTAAVSVVRGETFRRLPVEGLPDVLALTPGITFVQLDGLGYDPLPIQRGFYGGGEAEYLVVMMNGRPLGTMERGLVDWHMIPPAGLQAVEALRGGASSLYGDAAIGGVVNLITDATTPHTRFITRGGSYGTVDGALNHVGRLGSRGYTFSGRLLHTDGFREHADRRAATLGGSLELLRTPGRTLTLSTLHSLRRHDLPGPLTAADRDADRSSSSPFYRFDEVDEQRHRGALEATMRLGTSASLRAWLQGEQRRSDEVRTLALTPGFADTQARDVQSSRAEASVQATLEDVGLPFDAALVVGVDGALGSLSNSYRAVFTGTEGMYAGATGEPGAVLAAGDVSRSMGAVFAQLDGHPTPALRFSLGARLDGLSDDFNDEAPSAEPSTSTHTALSPKAGVNVRYVASARHVGNLYANVSRSFKAATLDQLYGQRLIPFGEFAISLSNPDLEPQRGTSYEVGFYHRAVAPGGMGAEASVSVYHMDMRNELDFSLETFSYVNIGKSRHRGVEAGLTLYAPSGLSAFGNYTLQHTTLRYGDYDGNFVKAIPRDVFSAGLGLERMGLRAGLVAKGAGRIYLDDANTERLPNWWTLDARLGRRFGPAEVAVEVFNVLDRDYSTTGYLLADFMTGEETAFYYPAAGRTLRLSVSLTR